MLAPSLAPNQQRAGGGGAWVVAHQALADQEGVHASAWRARC